MTQFWYIFAVGLVKASILCLYGRIFSVSRWPIAVHSLLVITSAWLIAFFFATLFQIWPIRCNWISCPPTTDYTAIYVACSVTDTAIDIAILCLPPFFIRKLRLSLVQKVGLASIFGLGILSVPQLVLSIFHH